MTWLVPDGAHLVHATVTVGKSKIPLAAAQRGQLPAPELAVTLGIGAQAHLRWVPPLAAEEITGYQLFLQKTKVL